MPKQPTTLLTLRELASQPEEQRALARRILEREHGAQVVQAAAEVLASGPDLEARDGLLRQYAAFEAAATKRDLGGYVRAALLRALQPIAQHQDVPLLERALWTYEFGVGRAEVAGLLRAAALVALDDVDSTLASYHATRLLVEKFTSAMSGEPAVTAARVLAARGHALPLYHVVIQEPPALPELVAESLRGLTQAPSSLLPTLVERYRESPHEVVLLGLYELILGHANGATVGDVLLEFLKSTRYYDVYRSVVFTIAAGRNTDWLAHLLAIAEEERDPRKAQILIEGLPLARGSARAASVTEALRARLR
ncbi:MAG: hypothetical protein HY329_12925 [Chloroflexi bacterium]|nr:hypothetical protein [Chloroflexota bacterium]